jgi:hypothetical protein
MNRWVGVACVAALACAEQEPQKINSVNADQAQAIAADTSSSKVDSLLHQLMRELLKPPKATYVTNLDGVLIPDTSDTKNRPDSVGTFEGENITTIYPMPRYIEIVAASTIREGLKTDTLSREFIHSVVNLYQHALREQTGDHHRDAMRKFDRAGNTDLYFVERYSALYGGAGQFTHDKQRNIAYFDANMSPVDFFITLPQIMTFGFDGPRPLEVTAKAHAMTARMLARTPELITTDAEHSPVIAFVQTYLGKGAADDPKRVNPSAFSFAFAYAVHRGIAKIGNDPAEWMQKIGEDVLHHPEEADKVETDISPLSNNFLNSTVQYMLKINPNMPEAQRTMLRSQINRLRASYVNKTGRSIA